MEPLAVKSLSTSYDQVSFSEECICNTQECVEYTNMVSCLLKCPYFRQS